MVPPDSRRPTPDARRRPSFLIALLLLTLAAAGVLAYEAWDSARSHRTVAERALRDYASFAAISFSYRTTANLYVGLTALFNAVGDPHGARGDAGQATTPVAALERAAATIARCNCALAFTPSYYFRLDLRDGTLTTAGVEAPAGSERAWLTDTVRSEVRSVYRSEWDAAVLTGASGGRERAIAYTLRHEAGGAPAAAYGFVMDLRAFGAALFGDVLRSRALLPAGFAAELSFDSVVTTLVTDPAGREVFRSPGDVAPAAGVTVAANPYAHESYRVTVTGEPVFSDSVTTERAFGGLVLRVALRPEAPPRLLSGGIPPSRLPLVLGLLGLTAVLVGAVVLLLRREYELARMRADFVSAVSHELRTPLAQILLFAETLSLDRVRSRRERRGAADIIVQETRRLMHLVDNILHFARSDRGGGDGAPARVCAEPIVVAPVVREVLASFAPLALNADVRLHAELDDAAVALADRHALRQMLLNLLDNALKYGPSGQAITVAVERRGAAVHLRVDDAGPGIPFDQRERIWSPFVRLSRDGNAAVAGSGIGLAVVRDLVALHGGRAWVEGAPGGGARFVIALRSAEGRVGGPRSDDQGADEGRRGRTAWSGRSWSRIPGPRSLSG